MAADGRFCRDKPCIQGRRDIAKGRTLFLFCEEIRHAMQPHSSINQFCFGVVLPLNQRLLVGLMAQAHSRHYSDSQILLGFRYRSSSRGYTTERSQVARGHGGIRGSTPRATERIRDRKGNTALYPKLHVDWREFEMFEFRNVPTSIKHQIGTFARSLVQPTSGVDIDIQLGILGEADS